MSVYSKNQFVLLCSIKKQNKTQWEETPPLLLGIRVMDENLLAKRTIKSSLILRTIAIIIGLFARL